MASWHKRARIGVAVFGLAVAAVVYMTMRERPAAAPPQGIERADPKAVLEIASSTVERFIGVETNFELTYERMLVYEDGSSKLLKPAIVVPKGEDRTFTITAAEGATSKNQDRIELTGTVKLADSDGFVLNTDGATVLRQESIARAPGAVTFSRGRMTGSGTDVSYDTANDVLTIRDQAQVTMADEAGSAVMAFTAGTAVLDRIQHTLTLEREVHVMRHEQVIDADRALARLSDNDDVVRFVELRGNARVEGGGGGIDAMSARDIDLDYSDDGERLEAMALGGGSAAALTGQQGTQQIVAESIRAAFAADGANTMVLTGSAVITMIGAGGGDGRRIAGDLVELDIAPDGTLTRAMGRERVRLDLPAAVDAPARTVHANALDGTGAAGQGLTRATFTGDVVFTEAARGAATARGGDRAPRTARAQRLETSLASDAVTAATFTGDATFEEAGLKACAARMEYQPGQGTLALTALTGSGNPVIAEEQVTIEAQTIDVTLASRRMAAAGAVRTQLGAPTRCAPAVGRAASERSARRMPGLLNADATATITAAALDYQSETGVAVYSGRAVLAQGATAIHADTISLDQAKGDLTATGNAVSTMTLDGETATGRAHEIRYVDATRQITYAAPPPGQAAPAPAPAGTRGRGPAVATEPELAAPLGHLRAGRIDIVLAQGESRAEQIAARSNVRLTHAGRTVTGGSTFTYDPTDEKYVISGDGATPVTVLERQGTGCRESSGRSLTFYKSNDTILIDGQNRSRTQIASSACPAPAR